MRFLLFLLLFVPLSMLAQEKLPAVIIKTIAGKEVNTESFQNSDVPLVISFWATWCKPCLQELDAFNDLTETWKKETPARIIGYLS